MQIKYFNEWKVKLILALPFHFNPFTAPADNISGMKAARTHLQTVYFLLLQYLLSIVRFDENLFMY